MGRVIAMAMSGAILGGAAWASWTGMGTGGAAMLPASVYAQRAQQAPAGARPVGITGVPRGGSIRAGSPGSRGPGSIRIK